MAVDDPGRRPVGEDGGVAQNPPGLPGRSDADAVLATVARSLRTDAERRWVEVSDRARARALRHTRRSLPVLAQAPGGSVRVSEQVVVTYLRDAVQVVDAVRVHDIVVHTAVDDRLTGVTLVVSARYGAEILPVADRLRAVTVRRLRELLGDVTPLVALRDLTVHVDDVH